MKKMSKESKIILLLIILFIISGIITLLVAGFEKNAIYAAGTRIEVYIPQGYEKQDILEIAKESFNGKEFAFEEVEKLNQVAGIKINKYTKEELDNFKSKISEKYKIEEDKLEIYEIKLPRTRIRTDIMPYVFPVTLVTVLSLIYVLFKSIKSKNAWKNILKIIAILAITLGIYFSILLIFRIPYGSYTMPIALAIYIITLLIAVNNLKKQ